MVTADELRRRSALVCGLLCQQPEYQQANVLMLFLSTPQEIDTSQLAIQAWADLKRVLAPRVTWDQRRMLPIEIQSLATDVYDRFLAHPEFRGVPCAVALEEQVFPTIPTDPTDARMNMLVTDVKVRRFGR